jgi:hypothetical protein
MAPLREWASADMASSAVRIAPLILLIQAATPIQAQQISDELRSPAAFSSIQDAHERSVALFGEAGKVIQHSRCINCHPAGDHPLQGEDRHRHFPAVVRGPENMGVPGDYCTACHHDTNVTPLAAPHTSIPGNPRWQLAPREMAWETKTLGEICTQLKDPERNGRRSLAELHEHMAEDDLVGWGWHPGAGRQPAPGTQQIFGALIQAWIDTGAACP